MLKGNETRETDFWYVVVVEIQSDGDVTRGGKDSIIGLDQDRRCRNTAFAIGVGPRLYHQTRGASEGGGIRCRTGLEVDHRQHGRGTRVARTVDLDLEQIRLQDHDGHTDQSDLSRLGLQRVITGGVRHGDRLQQGKPEVQVVDFEADGAVTGGIVIDIEDTVTVAVWIPCTCEGVDVVGAHGEDIDRLGAAIRQRNRDRVSTLGESELTAHIDKIIDNDSNIAVCLDYGIREVEK